MDTPSDQSPAPKPTALPPEGWARYRARLLEMLENAQSAMEQAASSPRISDPLGRNALSPGMGDGAS